MSLGRWCISGIFRGPLLWNYGNLTRHSLGFSCPFIDRIVNGQVITKNILFIEHFLALPSLILFKWDFLCVIKSSRHMTGSTKWHCVSLMLVLISLKRLWLTCIEVIVLGVLYCSHDLLLIKVRRLGSFSSLLSAFGINIWSVNCLTLRYSLKSNGHDFTIAHVLEKYLRIAYY